MAVERKTFLWIGNDKAFRARQRIRGITGGTGGSFAYDYGATGIEGWNTEFGHYWNVGDPGAPGSSAHMQTLDVFWNNTTNWAERTTGLSGGEGITEGGDPGQYFYTRATRIPHRGDNVIFEYVKGSTGNGLLRGYVGDQLGPHGINPTLAPEGYGKPFDAPLSPCLFGGYSKTNDGLSGEGSIWSNAETAGSSQSNRRGPLSSVKVLPSYFHQDFGVMGDEKYDGFFGNLSSAEIDLHTIKYWGGRVLTDGVGGPSGGSFGNVAWTVGGTGINIRALDVQLNSPYRMNNLSMKPAAGVPERISNSAEDGGQQIELRGGGLTPFTVCRLGHADNIINLNLGCHNFLGYGGTVQNFNCGDLYMPFATDAVRRAHALAGGAPEERFTNAGQMNSITVREFTIENTLRCDPCWYSGVFDSNTGSGLGSPDIIWGPFYTTFFFAPRVTSSTTVTSFPQAMAAKDLLVDDINEGNYADEWNDGGFPPLFRTFQIDGPPGNKRFSITTLNMAEFNPRWDVITSSGGGNSGDGSGAVPDFARRGFNNTIMLGSGCTITNLNVDAGRVDIGDQHSGGDTFDEVDEVADIVILGGYAEEKSLISGVHPNVPSFNAFYIGKGGVNETGTDFQIRSSDAEFDFGPGVFLRSGPQVTGVTGAGFKFVQAPRPFPGK